MVRLICFVVWMGCCSAGFAQSPRLIVRGDDMGFSHSGNEALIKSYREGIETSIEIIVPSPWFMEAVKMLQENPGVDVGIHLAITSEWDNIKWRPLTDCPSLRDENGYFYPMVYPNKNYPGQSISEHAWKLEDVENEFRAQVKMALKYIPRVSHLSAHMGCTDLSPQVKAIARKIAREFRIDIDPADYEVQWARYDGPSKKPQEKIQSFIRMLGKLERGKTYMFVDHPGIASDELKSIHHIGYEDVSDDRQGVTDLFTSDKVRDVIHQKGIKLISYKQLGKE